MLPQVLATRIVAVKASLCKLSTATAARACDFHAKLLLIAISSTLKSLLRPHVLHTLDKSPGDRLSDFCAKNVDSGEVALALARAQIARKRHASEQSRPPLCRQTSTR